MKTATIRKRLFSISQKMDDLSVDFREGKLTVEQKKLWLKNKAKFNRVERLVEKKELKEWKAANQAETP